MKKFTAIAGALSMVALVASATTAPNPKIPADATILHAWSWSFPTIADNMKDIAEAGYKYVQTSPANTCFVGEDGGMALFSQEGDSVKGKWYYHYQPIDWKVGNYQLGTRDQFKAMCDSARKYNVKVLVDVLPNHTAFDTTAVTPDMLAAAGGRDRLWHKSGFNEIKDYNDRTQCTLWAMGGLPDVNTENPDFQYYFLQYINDLINLGARGFRYDTAKHIGVPSDPVAPEAERNNFWDVATGREAVEGLSLLMPDTVFVYGEVLQDKNVPEAEYAKYMSMTASNYGHTLRAALEKMDANAVNLRGWDHSLTPDHLVSWVESHDTYCNAHESAGLTDDQIRMGWVFLTARNGGMPLFYSRPAGSGPGNVWGNNRIGERGNDNFKHPEVVAANKFRTAMAGQPENIVISENGALIEVERGSKGVALVNISNKAQKVKLATSLADGEYTDGVHGTKFAVKKGMLTGKAAPMTSYILM